mmetsp:Transcript_28291/g.43522  ORF Transcript_28291/g.43522 Transcript_28291/m.43522 type:complete len:522 (-) Transcript_28291:453-2018(-)
MFVINERGSILEVNKTALDSFGYRRDEFIGSNVSMIVGGGHASKHDHYLKKYMQTGKGRLIGKKTEMKARRKDGSEFVVELNMKEIVTDKDDERLFVGFLRSLTQQKEFEMELIRRQGFMDKIIEASCDALFVVDRDRWIKQVNEAAVTKFGMSRENLCRCNMDWLFPTEHSEWFKHELNQHLNVGIPFTERTEMEAKHSDGSLFPVAISISGLKGPNGDDVFVIFANDLTLTKKMTQIEVEKTATDVLLANVLPESIALKLKEDPSHIAEYHPCASILFADIVGFTSMSSCMEPKQVVEMLNELFSIFDDIVDTHELNKIKTIGDCYMVSSVPSKAEDYYDDCVRLCDFALDMIQAIHDYNIKFPQYSLNLRIGLNCGPVVAGIVGTKRFLYDLWGDAVNTASRMESSGLPGKCQVTKAVVDLVGDTFSFESRGLISVKGKGEMEAFFLQKRLVARAPKMKLIHNNSRLSFQRRPSISIANRFAILESLKALEVTLSESTLASGHSTINLEAMEAEGVTF